MAEDTGAQGGGAGGVGVVQRLRILLDMAASRKTERDAADLGRKVGSALAKELPDTARKGTDKFLEVMQTRFRTKMAGIREDFARGLINQKQLEERGAAAAKSFNRGVLAHMDDLRRSGRMTGSTFRQLSEELKDVGTVGSRSMGVLRGAALRLAGTLAAAFALTRMIQWGRESVRIAIEARAPWARLENALKNVGLAYANVADEVTGLADRMERMGVDDEATADTLATLIGYSGSYARALQNVQVVADLAAAKQMDMGSAADLVGKIMSGNTEIAQRYIGKVEKGADVMDLLRKRFIGAAEAQSKAKGGLDQLRMAYENFREAVGEALTRLGGGKGVLDSITQVLKDMTAWVENNADGLEGLGRVMVWLARGGVAILLGAFAALVGTLGVVLKVLQGIAYADMLLQRRIGNPASIAAAERNYRALADAAGSAEAAMQGAVSMGNAALGIEVGDAPGRTRRRKNTGGPAGGGVDTGTPLTEDELRNAHRERIAMLIEGTKHDSTRIQSTQQLEQEEARLARAVANGTLDLKERIEAEAELAQVRDALGRQTPTQAIDARIDMARRQQAVGMGGGPELEALEGELKDKLDAENLSLEERVRLLEQLKEVRDAMGKDTSDAVNTMGFGLGEALRGVVGGTKGMRDAFGLVLESVLELDNAMSLLGKGAWRQIVDNIRMEAKAEALKAGGHALMQLAYGIGRAAVGDAAGATAHFKSSGTFALAAAKWATIAGVAGMVGGGASAGGGGRTQDGDVGGNTAAEAQKKGPDIYITVDGVDKYNPRHQVLIGETAAAYQELEGGTIHYNGAPA